MTRKDYVAIAEILSAELAQNQFNPAAVNAVKGIAYSLADVMQRDNSRFDRQRFYAAVGI